MNTRPPTSGQTGGPGSDSLHNGNIAGRDTQKFYYFFLENKIIWIAKKYSIAGTDWKIIKLVEL